MRAGCDSSGANRNANFRPSRNNGLQISLKTLDPDGRVLVWKVAMQFAADRAGLSNARYEVRFGPMSLRKRRSKLVKIACRDPDLISRKGREVREGAGGDSMAETWERGFR